jgi:hypothetical protein
MREKEKKVFDNKEDFLKEKKRTLEKVGALLEHGGPFLIIGDTGDEGVLAIGGSPERIAETVAKMMARVEEFRDIIKLSVEALTYGEKKHAHVKGNSPISDIVDKLECESCPAKDGCEIFNLATEDFNGETVSKFLKVLHEKHPEMLSMMMSKGGEA